MYNGVSNLHWKYGSMKDSFITFGGFAETLKKLDSNTHSDTKKFKVNIQMKPECLLLRLVMDRQLEKTNGQLFVYMVNYKNVIICTMMERNRNTHHGEIIGEDNKICRNGKIDLFD